MDALRRPSSSSDLNWVYLTEDAPPSEDCDSASCSSSRESVPGVPSPATLRKIEDAMHQWGAERAGHAPTHDAIREAVAQWAGVARAAPVAEPAPPATHEAIREAVTLWAGAEVTPMAGSPPSVGAASAAAIRDAVEDWAGGRPVPPVKDLRASAQRKKMERIEEVLHDWAGKYVDPMLNIAAELHLFNSLPPSTHVLYLWRNAPSVILGRNQNAWRECNVAELERRGITLVRRHSGGGAVYHDLGNTNFSFVSPKAAYDQAANCALLLSSLREDFGINAELKGRNDVVLEGVKISGHAYKYSTTNALHHGTLLRDVDMAALASVLNPHKLKLQAKGVASVQSRVQNLAVQFPKLTHEAFCDSIARRFVAHHTARDTDAEVEWQTWDAHAMRAVPEIASEAARLADWSWRFGESPSFAINVARKFDWGLVDVFLDSSKGGLISRVKIFSDALFPDLIAVLEASLNQSQLPYSRQGLHTALVYARAQLAAGVGPSLPPECATYVDTFFQWLEKELFPLK